MPALPRGGEREAGVDEGAEEGSQATGAPVDARRSALTEELRGACGAGDENAGPSGAKKGDPASGEQPRAEAVLRPVAVVDEYVGGNAGASEAREVKRTLSRSESLSWVCTESVAASPRFVARITPSSSSCNLQLPFEQGRASGSWKEGFGPYPFDSSGMCRGDSSGDVGTVHAMGGDHPMAGPAKDMERLRLGESGGAPPSFGSEPELQIPAPATIKSPVDRGMPEEDFRKVCERWRIFVRQERAHLLTRWGEKVDPELETPLSEYPRPTMTRPGSEWVCLNGFWQYAVQSSQTDAPPPQYDGHILVPYPLESCLSGVEKNVQPTDFLWYQRNFAVPESFESGSSRLLLHFGAVDWQTVVYVNGKAVGEHSGGFDPFSFDVTAFVRHEQELQEVVVRVYDPTDEGIQPRGKQCLDPWKSSRVVAPLGMWYTPVSGIWQTVWMECVPREAYIERIKLTPDVDTGSVSVEVTVKQERPSGGKYGVLAKLLSGNEVVGFASGLAKDRLVIKIDENHPKILWTPNNPFLYDVEVYLHDYSENEVPRRAIDMVRGYTAMRKISIGPDVNGVIRMQLNNKNLFQYGPLDQGWFPDGLYTPASEEAMAWDIQTTKKLGFNMTRKHVKVESSRWYYQCDKLGLLVWQDMPNGSVPAKWAPGGVYDYLENPETDFAAIFEHELKNCIDALHNHPCITVWVPFNEAWGQYSSVKVVTWLEQYDRSRLVWVSGGNDFGVGSAIDRHVYPNPILPPLDSKRVAVLGEFGGLGHALEGHSWSSGSDSDSRSVTSDDGAPEEGAYATFVEWGYNQVDTLDTLAQDYLTMLDQVQALATRGLGAAVYTQFSDVERESNGLVTYDRRFVKLDADLIRKAHRRLLSAANLIVSHSHMDLVSLLQETMSTNLKRSNTVCHIANMPCANENLSEEGLAKLPRCTSLSSLFVSSV